MSDGYDLDVDAGSFTLTFIASQSLDAAVLTREHVVRMRIDGDHTQRVDPIARTPEGFLDEWLAGTWTDISHWSDASLEDMHDQMAPTIAAGDKEDAFSKTLGSTVRS